MDSNQSTLEWCACMQPQPKEEEEVYNGALPPGWIEVPSKSDPTQVRYLNMLTYQRVKKKPKRAATSTW
eukprot:CAMPEP_0182540930 /NCGR_PEP_ID=MMETSP1323-20130603/27871_1 /TAXON_ID=236787 /ORGANISM="Florenciella parvula, Strain RCC1693" /LENGTH=68 /DNA_ID=CAMNT_0024751637 /DNA_START=20 /DNA_END=223 /DNA_ORIENTATION=-